MEVPQLIVDLAIMLTTAAVVTIVFKKLRLPTILGYIVAGFLIGQSEQIFIRFDDDAAHFASDRQRLLHITHRTPIVALLTTVLKLHPFIDVDVAHVYHRDCVALIHLHGQHHLLSIALSLHSRTCTQHQKYPYFYAYHPFHTTNIQIIFHIFGLFCKF